jgi:putative transposase
MLSHALRQRCLAHKMQNLQSEVPEAVLPEFHARAQACYQTASPTLARLLRDDIVATYVGDLPAAVACIAHPRFAVAHRRVIRTTNLLERLFGEERRRSKVIPHALGERAALKLMHAALVRAAERRHGIRMTEFEQRQLSASRN